MTEMTRNCRTTRSRRCLPSGRRRPPGPHSRIRPASKAAASRGTRASAARRRRASAASPAPPPRISLQVRPSRRRPPATPPAEPAPGYLPGRMRPAAPSRHRRPRCRPWRRRRGRRRAPPPPPRPHTCVCASAERVEGGGSAAGGRRGRLPPTSECACSRWSVHTLRRASCWRASPPQPLGAAAQRSGRGACRAPRAAQSRAA
mmetsp:Transcript_5133/g.15828  ORF Transcript_5133/g.15828 Transcript_5133/m.15828 type:complete len:203 (+) Transcript_5133:93-701(+)